MGLFSSGGITGALTGALAGGAILGPLGSLAGGLIGGKLLGGRSPSSAPQFNPDLSELRGDIQKVRDVRDREIVGPRESAKLTLAQTEADRVRASGDISAGSQGRFQSLQDALARQGLGSGAQARLAQSSDRSAANAQQQSSSDFGRLATDITAQDIGAQEDLRNQALFQTPQLSTLPLGIQTQASANNMRAQAASDAARKGKLAGLGSLAGAGIGAAFGPAGAGIGASIGGGLFSSMG